ncbi:ATP-grasp fold amidoligase family protein [Roseicyclus mahoneyensis]|uniref:Teichuronopeptide biosynthesis TupA-like protein n=1 Tax=Roseicyclus mahoneyensis TaxID=164332 RepID=A0A316GZI8_9RHOB|nr:ATP-grasp fold amidoligase family protein [Roseicyclus mahoneyensis]PWK60559.1 teichuronopeptide biosynthesis TupA-like protein [Roseicyclus mahoneyensis]
MRLKSLLSKSEYLADNTKLSHEITLGPEIIRDNYRKVESRDLDIENHPSFSAKIHQRMIDFHTKGADTATLLADKLAVKDYVRSRVGKEFIPSVIWQAPRLTYNYFVDMPKQGILKCNEGCRKNLTLRENQNYNSLKKETDDWLDNSYYWFRREYQYYNIASELFVEEGIDDGHPDGPIDYIFYCFDGKVQLIQTGSRSHTVHSFFTRNWEKLNLTYRKIYEAPLLPLPSRLGQMIEVAEALSHGIDFIRVDLYQARERVLFGEMTLTPRAGDIQFTPSEWNMKLGQLWNYRYQF